MSVSFTVPGQPVGKARPRIGKVGQHARMFTPAKTVNYEDSVRYAAHQAMGGALPILGAVRVVLEIRVQIPASWSSRKQQRAAAGDAHPTTKPDIDNIEKAIFDSMNGIVWRDDVQVVEVAKHKRYSHTPGVTVMVETMPSPFERVEADQTLRKYTADELRAIRDDYRARALTLKGEGN